MSTLADPPVNKSKGYDMHGSNKFRTVVARLTLMDPSKPWPDHDAIRKDLPHFKKGLLSWYEMDPEPGCTDRLVRIGSNYEIPKYTWPTIFNKVGLRSANPGEDLFYRLCNLIPNEYWGGKFMRQVNLNPLESSLPQNPYGPLGSVIADNSLSAVIAAGAAARPPIPVLVGARPPIPVLDDAGAASMPVPVLDGAASMPVPVLDGAASMPVPVVDGAGGASRYASLEGLYNHPLVDEALDKLMARVQQQRIENDHLLTRNLQLEQRGVDKDRAITKLETDLAVAKSGNADLQGLLSAKDTRIRDLEPNFSACFAENSLLRNQATMGTARIAELESQFAASDARAATMEPQLAGKDARILTLEAELAEAKSTIRDKTRRATGGGSSVGGKRPREGDDDSDDEPVITGVTRVDAPVATFDLLEDDQDNNGGA